ncbi:MAG: CBS domain-containing protein [Polyangiaceae bacterium]|nr:CBS domain-containing protein [Polyangiaceae bacterium]
MKVRDIMTWPVTALAPTDTLAFAEQLMNVERVRHFPVVDGDVLVGLLSHRDILAAAISTLQNPSDEADFAAKRKAHVGEVMRGDVETVTPDQDAMEAADRILSQKIGCLPVVDERHHLVGIVTEADFVAIARVLLAGGKIEPKRSPSLDPLARPAGRAGRR